MAKNQTNTNQKLEKLSLEDDSTYMEDILDESIYTALKGEHKAFCLEIEKALTKFLQSKAESKEIKDLDKFKRKIVHKLCDLFQIDRPYVDVKSDETGDITITRTEKSKIPAKTIEEKCQMVDNAKKKKTSTVNPLANKKLIMKPKDPATKKSENDASKTKESEHDNEHKDDV